MCCPYDQGFDPEWHSFTLELEHKTNIVSNIDDNYFKSVTSGMLTRFTFDLGFNKRIVDDGRRMIDNDGRRTEDDHKSLP